MISISLKRFFRQCALLLVLAIAAAMLSSCGGNGSTESAGVGGTGIVLGKITGFGSIYVNGKKFETDTSQFTVDGNTSASQADLALGMVVKLEVELQNGVTNGIAVRVEYDDEIEGPVSTVPVVVAGSGGSRKSFTVFGQTVTIDQTATVFEMTGFNSIMPMDVLEISGFRVSANQIFATYVAHKGVLVPDITEVELRGRISLFSATDFVIDGVLIRYDAGTEIEVPGGAFGDGTFVEVEGIYQADMSVQASEIEFEEEGFGSDQDNLSLQGVVSQYTSLGDFYIGIQPVDASMAELEPANAASLIGVGVNVEVEGDIVNGVLIAEELEIRDGEAKLESVVSAKLPNNRFEVNYPPLSGSVSVVVASQTLFEDDSASQVSNFSLGLLNVGDFVKLEGKVVGGEVAASVVKRTDPDESGLQGPVTTFVKPTSITILGISYLMGPMTDYDGFASADDFFDALQAGDIVEIEDEITADGIADSVDFDD